MNTPTLLTTHSETKILQGQVLVYRVFDIADEIRLHEAERLIRASRELTPIELAPPRRSALVIRQFPIRLSLGSVEMRLSGHQLSCQIIATVWDYGAVSIAFHFNVAGLKWGELEKIAASLSEPGLGGGTEAIEGLAKSRCEGLVKTLEPALVKTHPADLVEDYVIYLLNQVEGVETASQLTSKFDLAALLWGEESGKLSLKSREEVMQYLLQYTELDCVVIDWNSAIVFDRAGQDLVEVLEFALVHLFELRCYDDLVDRRLAGVYDAIEEGREKIWTNSFRTTAREANARFIEISEFIERVDNSLKVVGDFYLATVYRNAARRFRIADWKDGVNRKLALLARVSELLHDEITTRRNQILELTIIALFLIEIIRPMLK